MNVSDGQRLENILRGVIIVALIGLVVVLGLFVRFIVTGGLSDVPRTEIERAVFAAEEAVRANPNDPIARVKLAAAYLEQNSPGRAEEQARIALRLKPDEPSAHYVLGLALYKQGKNKEALGELTTAVNTQGQLAGFYMDAYVALGRVQEDLGDLEAAEDSFTKAINYGPENSLLLYERGKFYERQKNWEMALYDYGWALTYTPDYEPARKAFDKIAADHPKELEKVTAAMEAEKASGTK
jgi:tetratricopeptide (TPR) repeat protein